MTTSDSRFRLATLISGGGRTVLNLLDAIDAGALPASVAVVIASRECDGAARLRARGFDVRIADRTAVEDDDALHDRIAHWIDEANVDLVCLCGYMRWLRIEPAWRDRVINIHPSLLPAFGGPGMYGMRVHAAVHAAGVAETGCTVHVVDDAYDRGPIVLQRRCPVHDHDSPETIAARVFAEECIAYPEAIRLFIDRRISIEDGKVHIDSAGSS